MSLEQKEHNEQRQTIGLQSFKELLVDFSKCRFTSKGSKLSSSLLGVFYVIKHTCAWACEVITAPTVNKSPTNSTG